MERLRGEVGNDGRDDRRKGPDASLGTQFRWFWDQIGVREARIIPAHIGKEIEMEPSEKLCAHAAILLMDESTTGVQIMLLLWPLRDVTLAHSRGFI